jgi:hypothetical protein
MRKQRGVTMIGWIFLLIPVAIVVYAGIRVGPVYYEYFKLISAIESAATELKAEEALAPATIRNALQRRFDTQYVDSIKAKDLEVTRGEAGWQINVEYDEEVPMFWNLLLLLRFDKTVPIN